MDMFVSFRKAAGPYVSRLIVLLAFIGIPLGVWWIASPMIQKVPLSEGYRGLMMMMVFATVAFGGTSAWLVWRDLADEP